MNALTPIQAEQAFAISPAEQAHRAAISMHLPNEGEATLSCRAQIAMIRDQASAGMRGCTDATYGVLNEVTRLAQSWIYAPAAPADLWRIRSALEGLMMAARTAERVERRKANGGG